MRSSGSWWAYRLPTEVLFGEGRASALGAQVTALGRCPVLVTDAVVGAQSFLRGIRSEVPSAPVFDAVEANPTVGTVDALADLLRVQGCDVVVAVGGGSVMDCAKAGCALARGPAGQSIRRYHSGGEALGPDRVPLIAVPTTSGTGSEVTPFAVLDDPEKGLKAPLSSPSLYPTVAVVDPALTYSMPLRVTASTGLDALSHAMEGYWSRQHQPFCDMLAMEAGRLVFEWFEAVCLDPFDSEGRRWMAYAATLAGAAFQIPKNAMVHACSFPLSSRFHLPHGTACAFVLDAAIRFNAPALGDRLEAFAAYCGFASVEVMAAEVRRFKRLGGLPCTLEEAGIPESALESLVAESFHPLMRNNPVEVQPEDLLRLYAGLRAEATPDPGPAAGT
ncbi:MAG: iron-containing alcohol dehydrogenase [Lentisphaeria bacterium]|nr:iron-containing alcohol dehydrogenase [Lentisphaeria bacterium]